MNWLDIVITVVLCWSFWQGLRAGLLAGGARLAGLLAGLVAAFQYYGPLAGYAEEKWQLGTLIHAKLLWPHLLSAPGESGGPLAGIKLPDMNLSGFGDLLPHIALDGKLKELGEAFSKLLASGILEICSFILIFLVVSGVVALLGRLLSRIFSFTLLGLADRLGGAAFGLARGLLLVFVLLAVAVSLQWPAAVVSGGHDPLWLSEALENSRLAPVFLKLLAIYKSDIPGLVPDSLI